MFEEGSRCALMRSYTAIDFPRGDSLFGIKEFEESPSLRWSSLVFSVFATYRCCLLLYCFFVCCCLSLKRDKWRRTPLHRAAKEGHKDVVEALISAGAEINAQVGDAVRTCGFGKTTRIVNEWMYALYFGVSQVRVDTVWDMIQVSGHVV